MAMMTSQYSGNQASGDHNNNNLSSSESGVELKSLLSLIDNVYEMSPPTSDNQVNTDSESCFQSRFKMSRIPPSGEFSIPGYVTMSETLLVPVKKYPKYNFVGRILGPRGMTVKQLEKETGCKIFVRGRASSLAANPVAKSKNRQSGPNNYNPLLNPNQCAKPSLSNISKCALTEEPLHVFIECYNTPSVAEQKMIEAVEILQDLLSPPVDGKDELKRQQLVDISLINGTYRATSASNDYVRQFNRSQWRHTVDPTSNPSNDLDLQSMDECDSGNSASSGNHHYHGGLGGNGDIGAVYGIPQQRRVWQKPRGPDTSSDEYAKSVSSREFVSEIVCKTKRSPVKNQSNDSLYQLPESVVSETMKVAKNLLASHKNLTFDRNAEKQRVQQKTPQYYSQTPAPFQYGTGDHAPQLPDFSVPPPPLMTPQPLIAPTSSYNQQYPQQMDTYQMCYYYPPQNYPSTSSSYPSTSNSYPSASNSYLY